MPIDKVIARDSAELPNPRAASGALFNVGGTEESLYNPSAEMLSVEGDLGEKIISRILGGYGELLLEMNKITGEPFYCAGGAVFAGVDELGVAQREDSDVDLFFPGSAIEEIIEIAEEAEKKLGDLEIEVKAGRGDPDRKYLTLIHKGVKYELTAVKEDFLPYAQELINGQIVVEFSEAGISALSTYHGFEESVEGGVRLPFNAENLNNAEWIYSCMRYLSEVCMHEGIHLDRFVLETIKEEFDNAQPETLDIDLVLNLGVSFEAKLEESFNRILSSPGGDTRLFIQLLAGSHMFRTVIPASWTLAHMENQTIYSQLRELSEMPTYNTFKATLAIGDIQKIPDEIFDSGGLNRGEIEKEDWHMSPITNAQLYTAAYIYHTKEVGRAVEGLGEILLKHRRELGLRELNEVEETIDYSFRWLNSLRAHHLWFTEPDIRAVHTRLKDFVYSHSVLLKHRQLISGLSPAMAISSYWFKEFLIGSKLESTNPGERATEALAYGMMYMEEIGILNDEDGVSTLTHDMQKFASLVGKLPQN